MRVLDPAWPPIDSRSTTRALSPSEDAYTAAASPAGPAPTTTTSNVPGSSSSVGIRVPCCARSSAFGSTSGEPSGSSTTGTWAPCWLHDARNADALVGVAACGTRAARRSAPDGRESRAPRGPRVGDDGELPSARSVLPPPLLEELGDEAVEDLVRRAPRLQRVVVDVPERHRLADRVRGLLVRPSSPGDEERALRMRMELVHALEKLLALQLLRAACRQHDGDRRVLRRVAPRAARARPPSTGRKSRGSRGRSAGARP